MLSTKWLFWYKVQDCLNNFKKVQEKILFTIVLCTKHKEICINIFSNIAQAT